MLRKSERVRGAMKEKYCRKAELSPREEGRGGLWVKSTQKGRKNTHGK